MIQLPIIVGGLAVAGAIWAFSQDDSEEMNESNGEKICKDHQKFFATSTDKKIIKSHATKSINKLIKKNKSFKIGKSGAPKERSGDKDYKDYNCIYPIAESKDKSLIKELEGIYNEKFKEHKKNDNIKSGSAGIMTDKNGKYTLYVAIN